MKTMPELLKILICPDCRSELQLCGNKLICTNAICRLNFLLMDGIPMMLTPELEQDLGLTREKWERIYKKQLNDGRYDELNQKYLNDNYNNVYKQLNDCKHIQDIVFLEIGCGQMFLAQSIAHKCKLVVGTDLSLSALRMAKKMLDKKGIKNYLLVLADVRQMPIRNNSVDLLYGGGVIEHFQNTQDAVCEMHRVLTEGGISFNTVPYLNLGSLTYRQLWGNIPNLPILKQLAELVHIKLLRSRHMRFGYELSFTAHHIKTLHKKAGFRRNTVGKFDTKLMFDYISFDFLKKICIYMADNYRLFWPMIKVIAEK